MIMTLVEKLAITLQRAKTQFEVSTYDLVHELPSQEMGSVYQNICDAIKTLETVAGTDAPALMAAEDADRNEIIDLECPECGSTVDACRDGFTCGACAKALTDWRPTADAPR